MSSQSPPDEPGSTERFSLRRAWLTYALFHVGLVIACAVTMLVTASRATRFSEEAQRWERAGRRASDIARLAREQYVHQAHTVILGDLRHSRRHDERAATLLARIDDLRRLADASDAETLDALGDDSKRLAEFYTQTILTALGSGDQARLRLANSEAERRSSRMAERADKLAGRMAARAIAAEGRVRDANQLMMTLSIAAALLSVVFSVLVIRRAWAAIVSPMNELRSAIARVGGGDETARVGTLAPEELHVVGQAINRMLDRLEETRDRLVQHERLAAIGRIAAGVAHEVNNPIGIIRGYIETMRESTTDSTVLADLNVIDEEARACQHIAEQLLGYARKPTLVRSRVAIAELAREIAEKAESEHANLDVETAMDPAELDADPVRLRQVMGNLLRNAVEAGGDRVRVRVTGTCADDSYTIVVQDDGPGASEETLEHLFEPFFTTKRGGTGLGLAVCFGLVQAHGGTIAASRAAEGGLAITIALPLREPEPSGELRD